MVTRQLQVKCRESPPVKDRRSSTELHYNFAAGIRNLLAHLFSILLL